MNLILIPVSLVVLPSMSVFNEKNVQVAIEHQHASILLWRRILGGFETGRMNGMLVHSLVGVVFYGGVRLASHSSNGEVRASTLVINLTYRRK